MHFRVEVLDVRSVLCDLAGQDDEITSSLEAAVGTSVEVSKRVKLSGLTYRYAFLPQRLVEIAVPEFRLTNRICQ